MEPKISWKRRWWLLTAAWAVAAFAAAFPYAASLVPMLRVPRGLLAVVCMLPAFPYGLMALFVSIFGLRAQDAPHYLIGWLIYAVLTVSSMLSPRRATYVVVYGALCLLLLLNVVGCHMMLHGYPKN